MGDIETDRKDADMQTYRLRSRTIATGNAPWTPSPPHADMPTGKKEYSVKCRDSKVAEASL